MDSQRSSFRQLCERARGGCQDSLDELLGIFRPYLLAIAQASLHSRLHRKVAPSDIVQEALVRAHGGFAEFRGVTLEDFEAWLRQILRNQLIDQVRAHQGTKKRNAAREVRLEEAAEIPEKNESLSPLQRLSLDEEREALLSAIQALPARGRQVVKWRHEEGKTLTEIAERLGCSVETVRREWFRSLQQLAQLLERERDT